jgi:tRNA nucleotidyltransferase/poly(A) polymerase
MSLQDRLLETCQSLNAELYLVGGSVRDGLLGLAVKDADYVVTGADLASLKPSRRGRGWMWSAQVLGF